ncbi:hypothetical protein BsWGS_04251 [Bradybaena similaris]
MCVQSQDTMGDADGAAPAPLISSTQSPVPGNSTFCQTFTEPQISNNQTHIFTFCQTLTTPESRLLLAHVRNITIGVLGIIANFAAAVIVTKTKKINSSLKIYLTSLTVNDIIFMAVLTLPIWRRSSRDLTCTMLALGSVSSFAVANLMVALITYHNYQAVFNAMKFRLVSMKTVSVAVAVVWLLGWSLSLMCIGSIKPQSDVCQPPLKLPKFVYFLAGTFSAVSTVLVLVLNFRVIYFIKSSSLVTPTLRKPSAASLTETAILAGSAVLTAVVTTPVSRLFTIKTQLSLPSSNKSLQTVDATHDNAEHPLTNSPPNMLESERANWRDHHSTEMQTASEFTASNLNMTTLGHPQRHQSTVTLHVRECSSRQESPMMTLKSVSTSAVPHLLRNNASQQVFQESSFVPQEGHVQRRFKTHIPKLNAAISWTLSRNSHLSVRSFRMRKVCITLCIITLWCCSLNLPNFVQTMISVSLENGRERLEGSTFSLASTTLVLINCLSQPIIYVWRFVDWSRVSSKLRRCKKN